MASTTANVEKPQAGQSVPVTLSEGQATVSCKAGDIESMQMTDGGKLLMTFKDGASITVNNFQEFAAQGSLLKLADGTTVNTVDLLSGVAMKPQVAAANDGAEVLVGQPPAGQTTEIELAPGHKYNFAFDDAAKESVTQEDGALIITFQDGGKLVLKNFSDALDALDPVQVSVGGEEISLSEFAEIMKLADAMNDKLGNDEKPVMAELREEAGDVSKIEPAAGEQGEQPAAPESQKTSMQDVRQDMTALAEQLAGIEPAAGGQAGGGSARAGGFGFQSAVDPANVLPIAAIGPIGPTALQFGLPTGPEPYYIPEESEPVGPPSVVANLGLNDAFVKEDGTIFVPIVATIGTNSDGDEVLTLTVTGIPSTWNPVFTGGGTYNPGTGTWTITMPPGTSYTGGVNLTPPAESDVDLPNITATVTVYDPDTGGTQTATDTFNVIVDAVADKPHVDAPDNQGVRGTPLAVTITGGLGSDQDGSESITHYTVTGLPDGFAFNKGTYDPVTKVWTFTPSEITGLLVTPPAGYHGSIPMVVTIYNKDTPTDREDDTADNTNSASDPFVLTWTPKITPPDLTIDNKADFVNGQVKEDGSVTIPVKAVLAPDAVPGEYLTVTITGIPSSWNPTFTSGSYDPNTGTWTVTLPANTNFNGSFTVSPPKDSDVDLSGLTGKATSTQPSSGLSASDTDGFGIIVDAVADKPHVNAPDNAGVRGAPLAVTITGGLGSDQDGSESVTHYTVTGLPDGFAFNKGTYDPVTKVWTFTPAQITGLTVTPPAGYSGTLKNLVVTIYNKDTPTDGEFDTTDNTNSASDGFQLTWTPKINPPDLTIDNKADFVNAQVKEDGSVTIPVKAVLAPDAVPGEYLTVTVTGIPSSWNPTFTSGSYDPNTGTWTVTLPPNTNFNGSFTVSPPKDSDVDLSGLTGTATATQPAVGGNPALTASDSDNFGIIVDAVADKPHVDAPDNAGVRGTPLAVTITGGLGSDQDGSESITHYTVTGLPDGFAFNKGTYNPATGVWTFKPSEITGLTVTPPPGYQGSIPLNVTIHSKDTPTDGEYDTSDNTNSASDPFTLTWAPKINPPDLTIDNKADFVNAQVKEDGSVTIPVKAVLGADAVPGEYLTVTITGIPSSWGFSAPTGTYNAGTGTWTVTLPPNTNLNTAITFTPPAQSDVDLSGLTGTATSTQPAVGGNPALTASDSDSFGIIVDAVADKPHVDAPDNSGAKGAPLAVTITGGLGVDKDGSESVTHYTVTGLPDGFSFNKGSYDPVTKVWTFTPTQITGLTVTPPANYHGKVDLNVTIYSKDTPTDGEYDTRDNTNSASDPFTLTWSPKINPPDIKINNENDFVNGQVKEDKSVTIPVTATLGANAEPGEYLTVTITGIPTSWGFSAPTGSYNPATGTWTVTLPPNTNLNTAITFTPPAQSDVDLSGLTGTVVATQPSSGLSASDSDSFGIIVDAVADKPSVDGRDNSGSRGQPLAVNISGNLGDDKDGSESITHYTVNGLPDGFAFNKGTYDPTTNTWTFTPSQITGLTVTPPANYQGSVNLTVTVYNKEGVTDREYDTSDNTNSASDPFTLTWSPKINPPNLTINNENDFVNGKVKEDGFVDIPVKAVLSADAVPGEYLTVTITGIPSSWGFSAPTGTYNAATGTWTVTLPPNTALNTVVRFTPPADSDIDLSGLVGTATSTQPAVGGNPALTASDTDSFGIIVDAVADKPTITARAPTLEEGNNIPVTINAATTDRDGSEVITGYSISGLPAGYNFNNGTYDSVTKVWNFTPAQIVGLQIIPPANGGGANFTLKVTVYNTENPVSDGEYDTADNNNQASTDLVISIKPDTVPTLATPDAKTVDETNMGANPSVSNPQTVGGQLQADFKEDAPGTYGANGSYSSSVTGLKSNGVAVDVTYANGVYTGKAGNVTVFTLQVNPNGSYSFTLREPLDHPNTSDHNDNIVLRFGATATDSDGDTVATSITINVLDDGVDAVNDVGSFDGGLIGYITTGNVMANDDLSQDTPNTISAIRVGTNGPLVTIPEGGEKTIVGDFGTLKIKSDGSYTYTTTKLNGTQDTFTYTLKDGDGDTDTATLALKGIAPTLIVGENVNDIPGSNTPWEVGNGKGKIEGGAASDILIGDVGGSALEEQGKDYNIVLMLDVSGSMGSKTDPNSRISLLVKAVKNLVGEFNGYEGGEIRVNIIGFASGFAGSFIFTATDDTDYAEAIQYLNTLTGNGFTNYEAALQDALAWHNGTGHYAGDAGEYRPITGAENISYFISDGQPNRYVTNNSGSAGSGDDAAAWKAAMDQIRGVDGTNEIAQLKAISEVIGVGINISSSNLNEIDSDGRALNVRNPSDLDAVLADTSPLTRLSGVGNDILNGGDGSDLIFGDSVNTDKLAAAMGLGTNAGSGWDVFARLELGQSAVKPGWTRADTLEYIRTHAEELGKESLGSGGVGRSGGDDEIRGGAGNDVIFGQEGNDHIWGGAGNDTLYGGSGKDTFHFEATTALNGVDTIKDFSFAQGDALDLSAMLTAFDPTQDAINEFVFATTVNGNTVISVDVTGSGNIANAQAVAILQGVTGVSNVEDLLTHNSGGNVA